MRVYRPSSLLMRKDSNSPGDKEGRGRGRGESEEMNVAEARRGRGEEREGSAQEDGIKERGKSQVGLAEELEWRETLRGTGRKEGWRGLSNRWQLSTWRTNLKAVC